MKNYVICFTSLLILALAGCAHGKLKPTSPTEAPNEYQPNKTQITNINQSSSKEDVNVILSPESERVLLQAIALLKKSKALPKVIVAENTNLIVLSPIINNSNYLNEAHLKLDEETITNLVANLAKNKDEMSDFVKLLYAAILALATGIISAFVFRRLLARSVLIALVDEEKAIFQTYEQNLRKEMKRMLQTGNQINVDRVFAWPASLKVDWFPIFKANAGNIGLLWRNHIKAVVETHAVMKSLIESYELNNSLLAEADEAKIIFDSTGKVISPLVPNDPNYKILTKLQDRAKEILETDKKYEETRAQMTNIKFWWFY